MALTVISRNCVGKWFNPHRRSTVISRGGLRSVRKIVVQINFIHRRTSYNEGLASDKLSKDGHPWIEYCNLPNVFVSRKYVAAHRSGNVPVKMDQRKLF